MENLYIFFIKNTHFCKGCCLLHYVNRNGAKIEVLMFSFIFIFYFFWRGRVEARSKIKSFTSCSKYLVLLCFQMCSFNDKTYCHSCARHLYEPRATAVSIIYLNHKSQLCHHGWLLIHRNH